MKSVRLHPWLSLLALLVWLTMLLQCSGCRPNSDLFDLSIAVVDAHGSAPDSGHALLVGEVSFGEETNPLDWLGLSDTLHWSPLTGKIDIDAVPSNASHLLISSPDPIQSGQWRTSCFPIFESDTCRLSVNVPYQILLRTNNTSNDVPPSLGIVAKTAIDNEMTLHHIAQPGAYNLQGQMRVQSFPIHVELRGIGNENEPIGKIRSATVSFQGDKTRLDEIWSFINDSEL